MHSYRDIANAALLTRVRQIRRSSLTILNVLFNLIPQIPRLEYRGITVSILNTAPRGIVVLTQPYL